MAVVSFAWIAAVEATPASQRPYIGSSTNNTELGLTFEYNGFGRVEGQSGRPGQTPRQTRRPTCPPQRQRRVNAGTERALHPHPPAPPRTFARLEEHRARTQPGPLRRATRARSACSASASATRPPGSCRSPSSGCWRRCCSGTSTPATRPRGGGAGSFGRPRGRRDPRLAATLVLGGWLVTEAVVLSTSKGIVHPYYVSALGPRRGGDGGHRRLGAVAAVPAADARAGAAAGRRARSLATVICEVVLMHRHDYMRWFVPVLPGRARPWASRRSS